MPVAAAVLSPPLLEGDRLTSAEFLTRWEAMPALKHAELIDGIVFMASPLAYPHGKSQPHLTGWAWLYSEFTPGTEVLGETTWILGAKDVPQPDIALRLLPEAGGQSSLDGRYLTGPPELIIEVTDTTTSRDLGAKKLLYERMGVREYITVLVQTKRILWRELHRGRYRECEPEADGLYRSRVFPGLWLDPAALWQQRRSVRTALEKGLRSPEHAAFLKKLAAMEKRAARKPAAKSRA
jgi:Uma2 family endonuclease